MEELCKLLELGWDENCIDWMQTAVDHCSEVISEYKTPDSKLWTAMRLAFASENAFGFASDIKLGPDSNPNELSLAECNTVLGSIAKDYFTRWPYFKIMEILSVGFWTLLLVVLGMLSVVGLLYAGLFFKQQLDCVKQWEVKKLSSSPVTDADADDTVCQKQIETVVKQDNSSSAGDGLTKTIIIKVAASIGDGVNNSIKNFEPIEIFCQPADGQNDISKELPYKRATIEEVLNFLENYPNKLRLMLFFDDIKVYNDVCKRCFMRRLEEKPAKLCSRSSSHISVSPTSGRSRIPVVFKGNSHISKSGN